MNVWVDGICKKCGFSVIEMSGGEKDYINTCTNPQCIEFLLHYCYDYEELDYYRHMKSEKLSKDSILKFKEFIESIEEFKIQEEFLKVGVLFGIVIISSIPTTNELCYKIKEPS